MVDQHLAHKGSKMVDTVSIPELPLKGGCQCGAVRYEIAGPPIVFYICHCAECQKQSASAFGQSMRINSADLTITGPTATFSRSTDSGNAVDCQYCTQCGTRLVHKRAGYGSTLNIKAGTLDDTAWLKPAAHIWTVSKQEWVHIPADALTYQTQPENFDEISVRWQEMVGADESA